MLNCHEYDLKNRVPEGRIPSRTVGLVIEASKHQNELMEDRGLANNNQPSQEDCNIYAEATGSPLPHKMI